MSGVALPNAILDQIGHLLRTAVWTSHLAVRPTQLHHHAFTVLEIGEVDDRFPECFEAFHESSMRLFGWYVKYIITLWSWVDDRFPARPPNIFERSGSQDMNARSATLDPDVKDILQKFEHR